MEEVAFMTCILRIDTNAETWQKIITKVLNNVQDVTNYRMNEVGMVEISGTVVPDDFLKMLYKAREKVELCHFQFGQCSSNLFLPPRKDDSAISNRPGRVNNMLFSFGHGTGLDKKEAAGFYGGRDGRFLHYGDPSDLKKSKDSSKEKSQHDHNHNHNHDDDHSHDRDGGCTANAATRQEVHFACDKHVDNDKQMKERVPLQSWVNSCCLM